MNTYMIHLSLYYTFKLEEVTSDNLSVPIACRLVRITNRLVKAYRRHEIKSIEELVHMIFFYRYINVDTYTDYTLSLMTIRIVHFPTTFIYLCYESMY